MGKSASRTGLIASGTNKSPICWIRSVSGATSGRVSARISPVYPLSWPNELLPVACAGLLASIVAVLIYSDPGYGFQVVPRHRLGRDPDGQGGRAWLALDARGVRRAGLDDYSLTDGITPFQPRTILASRSTGKLAGSFRTLKTIIKPETRSRAPEKPMRGAPGCYSLPATGSILAAFGFWSSCFDRMIYHLIWRRAACPGSGLRTFFVPRATHQSRSVTPPPTASLRPDPNVR